MRYAIAIAILASGCRSILGIEDPALGDGGSQKEDATMVTPDAMPCIGTFATVCLPDPIPSLITYTVSTRIDTCDDLRIVEGVTICVIAAETIHVDEVATVTTSAVDAFFVFVATREIRIDGALDEWNAGSPEGCTTPIATSSNGAAGGSFGTLGGAGGQKSVGGTNTTPGPVVPATRIRTGCPGGRGGNSGGTGGLGGAAIVLMAPTIHLSGTARINASGYAGLGATLAQRGGGGGGSGGLVVLDAPELVIDVGAIVIAMGGGGGEGAGQTTAGTSGARAMAISPIVAATGGGDTSPTAGDGGAGATTAAGTQGQGGGGADDNGGGGGGGGAGLIYYTDSTPMISGIVVPSPTPPP